MSKEESIETNIYISSFVCKCMYCVHSWLSSRKPASTQFYQFPVRSFQGTPSKSNLPSNRFNFPGSTAHWLPAYQGARHWLVPASPPPIGRGPGGLAVDTRRFYPSSLPPSPRQEMTRSTLQYLPLCIFASIGRRIKDGFYRFVRQQLVHSVSKKSCPFLYSDSK